MFSHIFVSVKDFDRALKFYSEVMRVLGNEPRFCEPEKPWAGWHSEGRSRPYFVICKPYDGRPHDPGNGQMIGFMATDRRTVEAAYAVALRNGGISEGLPSLRPEYHAKYYGAYFRDPEGNKICVASHGDE
ncbi:VOC family protein [Xenophilus arseniciresistens]|uniref:VOC family protein n=1 Tax=Xenophilus arseniciresistens TaxID=1283306 RepID=A0AAE3NAL5_9BURK|nr:VOC family protein [Xenophilus arseniciresistens]MDA7418008.1 VOC family protein [Xenophilus arseniciresistens]